MLGRIGIEQDRRSHRPLKKMVEYLDKQGPQTILSDTNLTDLRTKARDFRNLKQFSVLHADLLLCGVASFFYGFWAVFWPD